MDQIADEVVDAGGDGTCKALGDRRIGQDLVEDSLDRGSSVNLRCDRVCDGLRDRVLHGRVVDEWPDGLDIDLTIEDCLVAPLADGGDRREHCRDDEENDDKDGSSLTTRPLRGTLSTHVVLP